MEFLDSISAEQVREFFDYDPENGEFTWRESRGCRKAGQRAGSKNKFGHIQIKLNGVSYYVHRLAWLYHYGKWPDKWLDHKNGNPADNWISNLRLATVSQNGANLFRAKNNTSGFKGVRCKKGAKKHPWYAQIQKKGKQIHLGYFATPEEAHAAYAAAALHLFNEFARTA